MVYNPASYVAAVKETLAEKSGLPADQRRLIFTPCAQPSSEAVATADEEHSAEDVLSELHGWQVRVMSIALPSAAGGGCMTTGTCVTRCSAFVRCTCDCRSNSSSLYFLTGNPVPRREGAGPFGVAAAAGHVPFDSAGAASSRSRDCI